MKKLTVLLTTLLALPAAAMSELNIPAGSTYTVTEEQQRLHLQRLFIGDDATVIFTPGVERWNVRADRAHIGSNVRINSNGRAGTDGSNGKDGASAAAVCRDGQSGTDGVRGGDGEDAVSIRLQLGLTALGDLSVTSDGGVGGSGGRGGDGGAGAEFDSICKNAPSGGDAGAGGDAGDGGDGGDVTVLYWPANQQLDVSNAINLITVSAQAGASGQPGQAGKPGAGSEGRYVKKRTLTGNRAWVSGGDEGAKANTGKLATAGSDGRVLVEQALVSVMPAPAVKTAPKPSPTGSSSQADSDSKREIQAIKQELRSLLQRLDELETAD